MSFFLDTRQVRRIRRKLLTWYDANKRDLPWRRTSDPYAIWLSEAMLQQTQVATVIPYYQRFRRRFFTVQDLARAELDEVLGLWAGLGYYSRARNLHRAARMLVSECAGRFPRTLAGWMRLPGVGRYTAGAIASVAFGVRTPAVDGNTARVLARLLGLRRDVTRDPGRRAVWSVAGRLVPTARPGDFNQALMEVGAKVCLPGPAAMCTACPVRASCAAEAAGLVATLPLKTRRPAPKAETRVVAAIERAGRWLFVRRPPRRLWGGLWEMPSAVLDGRPAEELARRLAREASGLIAQVDFRPFCVFRHQLTHRAIRFVGYRCHSRGTRTGRAGPGHAKSSLLADLSSQPCWRALDDLDSLPMSKAMVKVISALREGLSGRTATAQAR
jgi:A/G-specific adenine glycosylase